MWEFFEDASYFGLWAVRKCGDVDFSSQRLFHVHNRDEAIALSATLNGFELGIGPNYNNINRLTLVDYRVGKQNTRAFEAWGVRVREEIQDEGRTLKLFITEER